VGCDSILLPARRLLRARARARVRVRVRARVRVRVRERVRVRVRVRVGRLVVRHEPQHPWPNTRQVAAQVEPGGGGEGGEDLR